MQRFRSLLYSGYIPEGSCRSKFVCLLSPHPIPWPPLKTKSRYASQECGSRNVRTSETGPERTARGVDLMFSTSFIRRTLRSSGVRALKPASGAARCFHASQAAYLSSPPSDVADATPAAAASSEVRENVLNAYRKLLTMAKIMPDCKKRADTLTQIRTQVGSERAPHTPSHLHTYTPTRLYAFTLVQEMPTESTDDGRMHAY